jgi:hypothetical protein
MQSEDNWPRWYGLVIGLLGLTIIGFAIMSEIYR